MHTKLWYTDDSPYRAKIYSLYPSHDFYEETVSASLDRDSLPSLPPASRLADTG